MSDTPSASNQPSRPTKKPASQDLIGVACCLIGGFFAVSILLSLMGQESSSAWTRPVAGMMFVFGSWPGLVLSVGVAALGTWLFLQGHEIAAGRPLVALLLVALGLSLGLGGAGAELGGALGVILPGALGGGLGALAGALLCLGLLGVGVMVGLGRPLSLGRRSAPQTAAPAVASAPTKTPAPAPRTPAPPREPEDGVTAAEAAFLVSQPPRRQGPIVSPSEDVRVRGGVPEGTRALRMDDGFEGDEYHAYHGAPGEAEDLAALPRSEPSMGGAQALGDSAAALTPSWESAAPGDELGEPMLLDLSAEEEEEDPFVELVPTAATSAERDLEAGEPEDDEDDEEELEEEEDEELEEAYAEGEEPEDDEDDEEELEEEEEEELEEAYAEGEEPEDDEDDEEELEEEEDEELEEAYAEGEEPEDDEDDEDDEEELEEADEELEPEPVAAAGPVRPSWEQVGLFDEVEDPAPVAAADDVEDEAEDEVEDDEDAWDDDEEVAEQEEVPDDVPLEKPQSREPIVELEPAARIVPVAKPEPEPEATLAEGPEFDDLVYRAGCLILEQGRVAVSMLERHFELDFDQACLVLDRLQTTGLIGPYMGGRHRDILLDLEEWTAQAPGVS